MKILKQKDLKAYREKALAYTNRDSLSNKIIEKPCLDHDHKTGHIRRVLDYNINQFLGKIESARKRFLYNFKDEEIPDILRNIADYLEVDFSTNPIHPKHVSIMIRKFSRMNLQKQKEICKEAVGNTSKERTKAYRKFLMKPENIYKIND